MNKIVVFISILVFVGLFEACVPKKPIVNTTTQTPVPEVQVNKDPFVPFTKELNDKLIKNNIDVKMVQYYIDQQLVLTRYVDNDNVSVKNGIVKFSNGKYVNEIIIPANTPVLCESIEGDGMRVSAEKGGNTFKFLNSKQYSPVNYIFNPDKWNKDGTCEVNYDNNRYTVNCTTCSGSSPNEAKLVIKQSAFDQLNKQTKVLKGNTIGSGGF